MVSERKLTEKQKKFVEEYLKDLNATQAAVRAGYSKKNADKIGSELLGKTRVLERLQKRQKQIQKKSGVTPERVIEEYVKIGFANLNDYLDYHTENRIVGYDDKGEPQYDWAPTVLVKPSNTVDGAPIQEVSVGKDGTFKFKLHNKLAALDKLGQHLGLFNGEGNDDSQNKLNNIKEVLISVRKVAENEYADRTKPEAE